MTLRVAVVGDSAMWGQGLKPSHQFARLAAQRIADDLGEPLEILPGLGEEPERGSPRSGAKIRSDTDEGDPVEVLLPSGASTTAPPGDRARFAMTFRSLFGSDQEVQDFLDARTDRPAARLFGEHPAPCPTVISQVRALSSDERTGDVRLVILNGGINDVDFEEVLDPNGPQVDAIDRTIQAVFRDRLNELLAFTRLVFPNAVIVVAGYFPALSEVSDRADLKNLFEFFSGKPEWQIAFNNQLQQIPLLRDVFNAIGFGVDVDSLIETAVNRTVFAAAHAHFWTRVTINALGPSVREPGVVYAHPAFLPQHALFAGNRSLLHSGYRTPGHGRLSVGDEMFETRRARIPRFNLLDEYRGIRSDSISLRNRILEEENADSDGPPPGEDSAVLQRRLVDRFRMLVANNPDLPSQILLIRDFSSETLIKLENALSGEIGRIEIATIASFIHPNRAGDERYADRIVTAYNGLRGFSLRRATRGMAAAGRALGLRDALSRRGIDPARGLRQLAPIAFVESVAIRLIELRVGGTGAGVVRLTLGQDLKIDFSFLLANEVGDLLRAFDVGDNTTLADITEVTLKLEGLFADVLFREVVIFLNGHEFFRGRRDQAQIAGKTVRFPLGG